MVICKGFVFREKLKDLIEQKGLNEKKKILALCAFISWGHDLCLSVYRFCSCTKNTNRLGIFLKSIFFKVYFFQICFFFFAFCFLSKCKLINVLGIQMTFPKYFNNHDILYMYVVCYCVCVCVSRYIIYIADIKRVCMYVCLVSNILNRYKAQSVSSHSRG